MKANTAKRFLALLLALVMALGLLPASALAEQLPPPEAEEMTSLEKAKLLRELGLAAEELTGGNVEQTDDMYTVNGQPYKVIYNDYIACYVSAEDGRYAILPAGTPLAEDAPTGSALFTIDGAGYVFGGDYPDQGSLLLQPRVAQDMVVTDWTIGDYVISQYHAITQDTGHENSYAVKVAYAAEYFGDGESEISARLILPAPLGEEEADGVLLTDADQVLAGASVVTDPPAEMAMLPGAGPRAFFVLDTDVDYLAPATRLTLGERADLEQWDDPMGMEALFVPMADPAAAYDFEAQTLTLDLETQAQNIYGALVNFGYYGLEAHALDLEVDESYRERSDALSEALDQAITLAEAGEIGTLSVEGEWPVTAMHYQVEGGGPVNVPIPELVDGRQRWEPLKLPVGAKLSFTLAEIPASERARMKLDVKLQTPAENETGNVQTPLIPDGTGTYTLTVPAPDEYGYAGQLLINTVGQEGYVRLDLNSLYLSEAEVKVVDCTPSRYYVKVGEKVTVRLNAGVPFCLDEATEQTPDSHGIYYTQSAGTKKIEPAAGSDTESNANGEMTIVFVVPQEAYKDGEYCAVGFTLAAASDYHYLSTKVLPVDAVRGGDLEINVPRSNGIARVKEGTRVTVEVPALLGGYDRTLSAISAITQSDNEYVQFNEFNSSSAGPVSLDTADTNGNKSLSFNMPDGDVTLSLVASKPQAPAHRVVTQVVYLDESGYTYIPTPGEAQVSVSVLPEVQTEGETVSVQIAPILADGMLDSETLKAPFDGPSTTVTYRNGQETLNATTHAHGREYSFVMPEGKGDLHLTVTVKKAATPVPLHTLSTRPLVEGEKVRWGVWARESYTNQRVRPADTLTGGSVQVPVRADVEYYIYNADPNGGENWVLERAYLASPNDLTTPLEGTAPLAAGYDDSNGGAYRTFTMPEEDCVIVLQGKAYPFEIATESLVLTGEMDEDGAPVTQPMVGSYARAYMNQGGGDVDAAASYTLVTGANAGETVYLSAANVVGFELKELWLLRDGYRDVDLLTDDRTYIPVSGLGDLYPVVMADRKATLRAVYSPPATLKVTYPAPTALADQLTYDGSARTLIAVPQGPSEYRAVDTVALTSADYAKAFFAPLEVRTPVGGTTVQTAQKTIGGVTVTSSLDRVERGGILIYRVEYSWLRTTTPPATLEVPIDSAKLDKASRVMLESAAVNHTNPEKFNTVTITGSFSKDSIKGVSLVRYKGMYGEDPPGKLYGGDHVVEATYGISLDKVTFLPGENGKPDQLVISDLDKAETYVLGALPDFSIKNVPHKGQDGGEDIIYYPVESHPFGIQVDYADFSPAGNNGIGYREFERDQTLNFRLHRAQVNLALSMDYMSILMDHTDNSYRLRVGKTEADVAAPAGYYQVATFHSKTGFVVSGVDEDGFVTPATAGKAAEVQANNVNSWERVKVTFNDCMFFESDLDFNPKLTFTEQDGTVKMESDGLRLNALNTPLYIPTFAGQRTLNLELEKGTAYSLNTIATEVGGAEPLTFTPGGKLYLGLSIKLPGADESLTIEGFSAGVDAIVVSRNYIDISGHLWMTWPLAKDVAYGGALLDQLRLEVNDGQSFAAQFKGVEAGGSLTMPDLGVISGGASCYINTFEHTYEIAANATVGPGSLSGELSLVRSEALGIIIPDRFMVDVNVDGVGIPLVPPVILAEVNGAYGGFDGLSKLIDGVADLGSYQTKFLNFRLILGGHFTLLKFLGIDAAFNSGFYDLIAEVSGNVGINDDFTINILDNAKFGFGLVGLAARYPGGVGRVYARVLTSADLNIGLEKYAEEFVQGGVSFEVGIIFDHPAKSLNVFFDQVREGRLNLRELINSLGLTYVAEGSGYAKVSFPKIMDFIGPFELASVGLMANIGTTLTWDKNNQLGGTGYASYVASGTLGGVYKVWAKIDLLKKQLSFGRGDPPKEYSFKSGLKEMTPLALSDVSVMSLAALPKDSGQPRLLYDTEAGSGGEAVSLMAADASGDTALKVCASKEPTGFAYRFTLDDQTAAGRYLLVRQVGGYDPAQLRLYGPDGQEVPLNVWSPGKAETDTMLQGEADYVYNAFFQPGSNVWLITAPQKAGAWTLAANRELAVQLWEQPYGVALGDVAVSGDPLTGGGSSLNHSGITLPVTGLEPGATYEYSVSLVQRNAPGGDALVTLPLSLHTEKDVADPYRKTLDSSADSITLTLSDTSFPMGLDAGDYYPLVTLYQVGQILNAPDPDLNGERGTAPVAQVTGYTPIVVTNAVLDAAQVSGTAAAPGLNQSIDLTFAGASQDTDYSAVTDAKWEISAYQIAVYDSETGATALTRSTTAVDQDGNPVHGDDPLADLAPYTVRKALTYTAPDDEGKGSVLDPAGQDDSHSLNLSGLEPGTYTVGVTPLFRSAGVDGLERAGTETVSSAVEVKEAKYPNLDLIVTGGNYEPGTGTGGTLFVHEGFALTVEATGVPNADISVSTFGAYTSKDGKAARNDQLLKEAKATLILTAEDYFGKTTDAKTAPRGDYDNLLITATDPATKGTTSRLVRVNPVTNAPFLALDHSALGAVGNEFTISGRTEAGLTVHLLNTGVPASVVADALGRFSFIGALPAGTAPADLQLAVSVNGPSGLNTTQAVQFTRYTATDFSALELAPADTVNMTEGDAMSLTVQGVLASDGTKVVLSPAGLTFAVTGTSKVAGGILTAGAGTSTVTAKLGDLTSNVLTISGEKKVVPTPTPTPGGGGGGASTYRVSTAPSANGSVDVSPKSAAKGKTVTITPKPDTGYAVDTVLVTDSKGEKVPVTAQADGTYTFTMPGRVVTVTVTFKLDAWENPFTDVAQGDWFYPYVEYVHRNGLFAGTSDTAFSPNVTMNRAMLWTVLARLDGQDTSGGTTWYEKGRTWAMSAGVSDGTDPEGPVSREQAATMLYRYAESKGVDVNGLADLSKFSDAASVSSWASEALAWANAAGIVTGKPGDLLDPQGKATRAEVAAMLKRYSEFSMK